MLAPFQARRDHGHDPPAAQGRRNGVERRQVEVSEHRAHRLGHLGRPLAEPFEDLGGALGRPDDRAGLELVRAVCLELRFGDDREPAAAPAHRPEQLGLVLGVNPPAFPVRGDDLERADGVRSQAVRPAQPACAAAEREADHADGRRQPEHRRQAVRAGGVGHVPGARACLHAHSPCVRVDGDAAHRRRLQQDRALERTECLRAVARRLRSDAETFLAREPDDGLDVLATGRLHYRIRPLVHRQVPGAAGVIPPLVARHRHATTDARCECFADRHTP
jgi:hypothetical protein